MPPGFVTAQQFVASTRPRAGEVIRKNIPEPEGQCVVWKRRCGIGKKIAGNGAGKGGVAKTRFNPPYEMVGAGVSPKGISPSKCAGGKTKINAKEKVP